MLSPYQSAKYRPFKDADIPFEMFYIIDFCFNEFRCQQMAKRITLNVEVRSDLAEFEVDWDGSRDPAIPVNWSLWYKIMVIGFASFSTWVV